MHEITSMVKALSCRSDLTGRLVASLEHLNKVETISIISSWIPLDDLQEIVEFQEDKDSNSRRK